MSSFEKVSADLREAMGKNVVTSIILGIGFILMFVGAGCTLFNATVGYYRLFGTGWFYDIFVALDSWLFVFGALGAYAAGKYKQLTVGFGLITLSLLWTFVDGLIPIGEYDYFHFYLTTFVSLLIMGVLTYALAKKTFLAKK